MTTAISFGRLIAGDITGTRFLVYAGAQFFGAFMGALWVWIIYLEAIKRYPTGFHSIETAGMIIKDHYLLFVYWLMNYVF